MPHDALLDGIRRHVDELGYELADLRRVGTLQRPILQVRIDRLDSGPGHGITADDCAVVSRSLERYLEGAGLVGPRYVLEVSSPGLERPLRWAAHWRRFTGHRVRLRARGLQGRQTADILAVTDDDHVRLRLADGTEATLGLADIEDAVLAVDWPAPPRKQGARRP
jgi:ribosome maturation factor RimP